ncbi:MAG: helix-turn-helix transcriptional regulator [Methanosarcina thermophila]|jgi:predicted transcriptional regulator|uniref:Predicted transcriptional regulator, contains HTH domain n=3 Tax=Methanosarcina thermophila TaxID=2210 RepID=A0A1I6YR18_METTE|nr:winged helix-turn-helix domain-containing protein [Methanosarcina thermophila]ALK05136.1 MAG: ArsR family transcriptional regulator [Methanosarcina sp. 795]AKB13891.1 Transcriptional regulator, ArsR family [Methanosarcina thermophila TM-1]AKB15468.1 Transcriptional regulator, ArsR family [Methanosarcina thermophila CHTI-55]NLU56338.1 winged helix-turn-helix domain-containing protein [Methanosarcina thermophila]SFT52883.1 Predicted transcriptional regulator, contains HTH domain [Methanosarci
MSAELQLIDTIFFSDKRKNLLLLLKEGPKTIEEIKTELNVSSSPIMAQIRILLKEGLLVQKRDSYELSIKGKLIVPKMEPLLSTFRVFDENHDYWARQDLKTLPSHLLDRIGELGSCKEILPKRTHIFDYPPEIMDPLYRSKTVMEISSFFRPGYPSLYLDLAKRGIEVSLVLERSIYEKLISDYRTDAEEFLSLENTHLFVCDNKIELASSIVTDRFISLSMISKEGRYYNHEMVSFEKSALAWGQELFKYYKDLSEEITELKSN